MVHAEPDTELGTAPRPFPIHVHAALSVPPAPVPCQHVLQLPYSVLVQLLVGAEMQGSMGTAQNPFYIHAHAALSVCPAPLLFQHMHSLLSALCSVLVQLLAGAEVQGPTGTAQNPFYMQAHAALSVCTVPVLFQHMHSLLCALCSVLVQLRVGAEVQGPMGTAQNLFYIHAHAALSMSCSGPVSAQALTSQCAVRRPGTAARGR